MEQFICYEANGSKEIEIATRPKKWKTYEITILFESGKSVEHLNFQ